MVRKYFGTDGIRGRVGEEPMTAPFILKLGWAVGRVLASERRRPVIIGKDTRISGYLFESALEAGLSSAGVDSLLLGPMPTPAVAYLTRTFRACAGIVISASHNPYYDNGLKFFSEAGTKLPDATETAIEQALDQPLETVASAELGKADRIEDAAGRYIEFCKSTIPLGTRFSTLRIVVDSAHGATYHIAKRVFRELGAEVFAIGDEPDGLNINQDYGSTAPANLQQRVRELRADVGIGLDGDGDRVLMVDGEGEIVDGDELLLIIATARQVAGELHGGVVGTVMSNLGLEHALRSAGIPFKRSAVGDRYVMEMLREDDWLLGGESSGHIICLDKTTTGDGIVSALQVLAHLEKQGQSLHDLKQGMTRYPQSLINVPMHKPVAVHEVPEIREAVSRAETELADKGRVLLRPSGTEPVVRVMVEGRDRQDVERIAHRVAQVVGAAVEAPPPRVDFSHSRG
ncbi:MAG: phosphoglucosamine mutase [Gammaproteobacteria bacterium]|nr:phosphoglucosamine mutase [Gammaproteobacteria bacterium]